MSQTAVRRVDDRALHHEVRAFISDLIQRGDLAPGDRLNEAEIARQLGISRTPVREAFVRLVKDGLLVHAPRRGVFVTQATRAELEEITSLRTVLEGFAARRLAQRADPEAITGLRELLNEGVAAGRAGDWLQLETKNAEFHARLVASAEHGLLLRAWETLTPLAWKLTPWACPSPIGEAEVEDFRERHQTLLDAIASGDPDLAETIARQHVQRAGAHILDKRAEAGLDGTSPSGAATKEEC